MLSDFTKNASKTAETTLKNLYINENPAALVQSLMPYDLLMTWNIADDEQRIDLLKMAKKEQVSLLVDLSCWSQDIPNISAVEEMLSPLVMSGFSGAIRAVDLLEDEIRTLIFKRSAIIHLLENRNDPLDVPDTSELIPAPDGHYFIEFPDPDQVTDVERALFQALFLKPFDEYQKELECIKHDLPSELSELAYNWRKSRLADCGFTTREDAIELLIPRSVDEIRKMAAIAKPISSLPMDTKLPVLYRDNFFGSEFLGQVFEIIANSNVPNIRARSQTIEAELTGMINLYLSATGIDIGKIDAVVMGTIWVRNLFAFGLHECANGDEEEGAHLLSLLSPGFFLKVALGIIKPLGKRANVLLSDKKLLPKGRKGTIFDPPYYIALTCLARDIPCYWPKLEISQDPLHSLFIPKQEELMTFSNQKEVQSATLFLEEAEMLPTLLFNVLKCEQPPLRGTPASILVLNALANAASGRDPFPKPILREEANVFADQVLLASEDQFLTDSLAVLAPLMNTDTEIPQKISG